MEQPKVLVRFFASTRELVGGIPQMEVFLRPGLTTVGELLTHLGKQFPALAQRSSSLLAARNRRYAKPATELAGGDEVAFFPPVSGG